MGGSSFPPLFWPRVHMTPLIFYNAIKRKGMNASSDNIYLKVVTEPGRAYYLLLDHNIEN
jgi:hypothetical protein